MAEIDAISSSKIIMTVNYDYFFFESQIWLVKNPAHVDMRNTELRPPQSCALAVIHIQIQWLEFIPLLIGRLRVLNFEFSRNVLADSILGEKKNSLFVFWGSRLFMSSFFFFNFPMSNKKKKQQQKQQL